MIKSRITIDLIAMSDLQDISATLRHELCCMGAEYASQHRHGELTDAEYKQKRTSLREQGNLLRVVLDRSASRAGPLTQFVRRATETAAPATLSLTASAVVPVRVDTKKQINSVIEQLQLILAGNAPTPTPVNVARTDPSTHTAECDCFYCKEIK